MFGQCRENLLVAGILCRSSSDNGRQGHAEMRPNLLEAWSVQPLVFAGRSHTLNPAPPMFDQPELLKYPPDYSVAEL